MGQRWEGERITVVLFFSVRFSVCVCAYVCMWMCLWCAEILGWSSGEWEEREGKQRDRRRCWWERCLLLCSLLSVSLNCLRESLSVLCVLCPTVVPMCVSPCVFECSDLSAIAVERTVVSSLSVFLSATNGSMERIPPLSFGANCARGDDSARSNRKCERTWTDRSWNHRTLKYRWMEDRKNRRG